MLVRPMRGVAPKNPLTKFPYLISPKIDGMRAMVKDGVVYSKTMKPIPNENVQAKFRHLEGADGELTVGPAHKTSPTDDVFDRSRGHIMRKQGDDDFQFWVFDRWDLPDRAAWYRYGKIKEIIETNNVHVVDHHIVHNQDQVDTWYQSYMDEGYEGAMLRQRDGLYKYGQSTEREGYLLKLKSFLDAEAIITGVVEQQENTNEKEKNELGYSIRSTSKAGLIGKNTLGAFLVRDLTSDVEFAVGNGPGLTQEKRQELWDIRNDLIGQYIRYKYQELGTKNAPRLPQFLGFRDAIDISELNT